MCVYIRQRSCYIAPRAPSVQMYTPAYATGLRAPECACLPVCVFVRCGALFLRAWVTLTVRLARLAAPHLPKPRGSVSPNPPHGLNIHLLWPPAHPPTCPCWVGRPWIPKPAVFNVLLTRGTLLGHEQPQKESNQRVESSKVGPKHPGEPPRVTGEIKQDTNS